MKRIICLFIYSIFIMKTNSQMIIPLYKDSIPNNKPGSDKEFSTCEGNNKILIIHEVTRPSLTAFFPPKNISTGQAVIICPGGGYSIIAAGHEGYDVAKRLNEWGIAAFVLKYRIPNDQTMVEKEIGPLQDALKWEIDPKKIGIMGFSAGGHLASSAGTHYDKSYILNPNKISLRPDFMILIYPVISFTDNIGNLGSRENLIGKSPREDKIREFSNEYQVNSETPPAFLVHAGNDDVVKVKNSIAFYEAEQNFGIPAELHIYPKGGHGFGMNNETTKDEWMERLKNWLSGLH